MAKAVQEFLEFNGILYEHSAPYVPEQNGIAERENRTLGNLSRSMLEARSLPKSLWAEAVMTAAYVLNRVPNRADSVTPYEMWFGEKPNVSNLRIFGCRAYGHIHESLRKKLDNVARKLISVGYTQTTEIYRLWEEGTKNVHMAKHVQFNEDADVGQLKVADPARAPTDQPSTSKATVPRDQAGAFVCSDEPSTIDEALSSRERQHWQKAVDEELNALVKNGTWEMTNLPAGRNPSTVSGFSRTRKI